MGGSVVFFQSGDGIRCTQGSRGLGNVYKRQGLGGGSTVVGRFRNVWIIDKSE